MSQLVRLRGKHTVQCTHCAMQELQVRETAGHNLVAEDKLAVDRRQVDRSQVAGGKLARKNRNDGLTHLVLVVGQTHSWDSIWVSFGEFTALSLFAKQQNHQREQKEAGDQHPSHVLIECGKCHVCHTRWHKSYQSSCYDGYYFSFDPTRPPSLTSFAAVA